LAQTNQGTETALRASTRPSRLPIQRILPETEGKGEKGCHVRKVCSIGISKSNKENSGGKDKSSALTTCETQKKEVDEESVRSLHLLVVSYRKKGKNL